ncbi:MAG: MurR/RpiR family transcriptional regulator [Rhodobacteraceae bacterium]|nr:MurR/RpiR family transcriptional regulator [Paracoccaceae bacterium]
MIDSQTLEDRVVERYPGLSAQLRRAADYVVANPLDIASRSLRSISADSDVSPSTYSRLARALGYVSYDQMKDTLRLSVGRQVLSFSEKAERLRHRHQAGETILDRQTEACIDNIRALTLKTDPDRLAAAVTTLRGARRVVLFGALGSAGIVEYMAYLAQYFAPTWVLAGRQGGSLASAIAGIAAGDAVLIVTKAPYVLRAVTAARLAREAGAQVIVITDMHHCPALAHATHAFIIPSDSPQFFSSYVATLAFIEALVAMFVASSEADATASIRRVEANNRALGEYWAD